MNCQLAPITGLFKFWYMFLSNLVSIFSLSLFWNQLVRVQSLLLLASKICTRTVQVRTVILYVLSVHKVRAGWLSFYGKIQYKMSFLIPCLILYRALQYEYRTWTHRYVVHIPYIYYSILQYNDRKDSRSVQNLWWGIEIEIEIEMAHTG